MNDPAVRYLPIVVSFYGRPERGKKKNKKGKYQSDHRRQKPD
jgi:hypothetical protein